MIIKAHAKLNLAINVLDKQDDGFHKLDMVMVPLDLHDSIEITKVPKSFDTLVTCDDFDLVNGEYNLCSIAVNKMRAFYKFEDKFRIHIHKRIPMSAGLGGGSSNAAAVVRGIILLLKLRTNEADIIDVCRSIGSDVPFFFKEMPCRVQGTGEVLTPINVKRPFYALIVKPQTGLSTKEVFNRFDDSKSKAKSLAPIIQALENGDISMLAQHMFNDLEPVAISLCPEISLIKRTLLEEGLEAVMMTGSGSAVFALSEDFDKLEKAAKHQLKGHKVLLTKLKENTSL